MVAPNRKSNPTSARATPRSVPLRDLFGEHKSSAAKVKETHTAEIVIVLCGPIGSPLHDVAGVIKETITDAFNYEECKIIRLSEIIEEQATRQGRSLPKIPQFERINAQIEMGNKLREEHGASVLVEMAIQIIRLDREREKKASEDKHYRPRRVCHIIDSVKNQEEMNLLRLIYRDMAYFIGVFSPLNAREQLLKNRGLAVDEVYRLINRDSGEELTTGQTVSDTFPQCDFFLRSDLGTDSQLKHRVERFLHLILGTTIITPTPNESAMYAAASAASNSACLSRQVGAAVTNSEGEIIAVGWNDVPRVGGGLYASGGLLGTTAESDLRCWNVEGGKCFNDMEKELFAETLVNELREFIPEPERLKAKESIAKFGKLKNLIEFSRAVHAEMHALINAGNIATGKISGGKMFVTTYPCHSCARHIIASGIREVYYIEPYRKSLAVKLHWDAISENEDQKDLVRILPYDGVAPTKFLALFRAPPNSRKENGKMKKIPLRLAVPRIEKSLEAVPVLEALVVQRLQEQKLIPENAAGAINDQTSGSEPAA